jgi:hypothetical protein
MGGCGIEENTDQYVNYDQEASRAEKGFEKVHSILILPVDAGDLRRARCLGDLAVTVSSYPVGTCR